MSSNNNDDGKLVDNGGRKSDQLLILMILIPLMVIVPVLPGGFGSRTFVVLLLCLFYATGVYCIRSERRKFLTACILSLISAELLFVSLWPAASTLFILGEFFLLLFLVYLIKHFINQFVTFKGDIIQIIVYCLTLILLGGMACGTGLHLSGIADGKEASGMLLSQQGFGAALLNGVLIVVHGGAPTISSPLVGIIVMMGSISGFILLIAAIGKIVEVYGRQIRD